MGRLPVPVRLAAAFYALLLRLLPARIRSRRGHAMRGMFRSILLDAHRERGIRGVLRVTLATVGDLLLFALRRGARRPPATVRRRRSPPPEGPATPLTPSYGADLVVHLLGDVRIATRSLRRRPTLVAVATLTLALGIGAVTAVFSVVWGAWLKPLPYPEADRLVRISDRHESFEPGVYSTLSIGNYVDMEEGNRTLESTTIFTFAGATLDGTSRRLSLLWAEPTLFRTLGVEPALGRDFAPEDVEGDGRVIVLSHAFWERELGGSTEVLGRTMTLDDHPWRIIGVAPEDFELPREVDGIIPFRWTEAQRNAHGGRSMNALGRLRPGVSIEAARADLQAIYAGIAERYPENHEGWTAWVSPFREYVVGSDHTVLRLMSAAAALLLLIGCVNVASLLLARAESRKREVALRGALGAGRGRILSVFLGESLLIGVLGGAAGVGVALGGIGLLVSIFGGGLRRPSEIGMNGTTLAVALGLTLGTSLAVALVPGLRLDPSRLAERLREGTRGTGRAGVALRKALVVTEIVLAVVLVSGAGLLLNTMWRLSRADLGFEPRGAVAAYLQLPEGRYTEAPELDGLYRRLSETLERQDGIAAVGAGDRVPPDANITTNGITAVGRPESSTDFVLLREVTPGYFGAVGIGFVAGRPFEWLPPDTTGSTAEVPVVINRTLAESLFPRGDALGRLIASRDGRQRVVGVVDAVRQQGATAPARPALYYPWPAVPLAYASRPVLVVRARGSGGDAEGAAVAALRRALEGIDPEIRFTSQPLREGLGRLYGEQEFALSLMGVFAGLALLLGAVGVYGILSFTVAERTREMGVRIALGAARGRVVGMVLRQGMELVVVGVLLGLAAAAALGRFLAGLLYEISPVDALTYGVVAVLFLGTAAVACLVPARRAARVEPTEALRAE